MNDQRRFWEKDPRAPKGIYVVDFELSPATTALVIVDMQKYMCRPDVGLGLVYVREAPEVAKYWFAHLSEVIVPNIRRLLDFFRHHQLRVAHVCVGPLLPDGSDMIPRRRTRDQSRIKAAGIDHLFHQGTPEYAVIDELAPQEGEIIFKKNTQSAFTSTHIDPILQNMGIESLIVTGVATSTCVEITARDAADRGYNTLLVEDACGDKYPDSHKMTLVNFARASGKVLTTQEIMAHLQSKLSRP